MKTRLFPREAAVVLFLGIMLAAVPFPSRSFGSPVSEIYNNIKAMEKTFPFPEPSRTVHVASIDGGIVKWTSVVKISRVTGSDGKYRLGNDAIPGRRGAIRKVAWNGNAGRVPGEIPAAGGNTRLALLPGPGGVVQDPVIPNIQVNAVNVFLGFTVSGTPVTLTVNGKRYSLPVSGTPFYVPVERAQSARIDVVAGARVRNYLLKITRPAVVGAGAYKMKALPVVIVYDPPQSSTNENYTAYETGTTLGTSISTSFSRSTSTTTPVPSEYQSLGALKSTMGTMAGGLSQVPNPYAQAAGAALGLIAGGLPTASASETTGETKVNEKLLTVVVSESSGYMPPAPHLGPGVNDMIVFMLNPRFVWVADITGIKMALLGYDQIVKTNPKNLKGMLDSNSFPLGLDAATVRNLLAMDPFVYPATGQPVSNPQLNTTRFREMATYTDLFGYGGGGCMWYDADRTMLSSDFTSITRTTTLIEDYSPGFLSMFGAGPTEAQQVTTTNTNTTSKAITAGQTLKGKAYMCTVQQNMTYSFYQDLIWNSILVYPGVMSSLPRITGVALDASGSPLARERVTLVIGGRKFVTFSDSQGKYSFSAASMPSGQGTLSIRTTLKSVSIQQIASPLQTAPTLQTPLQQAPIQQAPTQTAPIQQPTQWQLVPKTP